jgi:hypothetical protein
LTDGQTGTGTFTLSFANAVSPITLGDFYVRYQSVSGAGHITSASGNGTLTSSTSGGSTSGGSTGGTPVSEPGMLGLLGGALLALGLAGRRRRKFAAA